jgi:hypothetical protein
MLAMPFPLFYASKRYVDILAFLLIYICTVMTGSRGGLLMGTVEFIVILIAFAIFDNTRVFNRFFYISIVITLVVAGLLSLKKISAFCGFDLGVGSDASIWECIVSFKDYFFRNDGNKSEARVKLLDRMIVDFKNNPLFGTGIGYTGNSDIYNPKAGAMNWYHMWFAQVIGGLGITGILAYGYQLVNRFIIFFKNFNIFNITLMLSYFGLFIMSQVNPGEFCPMPYAALAVTLFIIMEKDNDDIELCSLLQKTKEKFTKKFRKNVS